MWSRDNVGDSAAGDWRQCGDLADVECRRRWRLGSWGVETTLETWRLGSGDDVGDLAAGEWRQRWRRGGWGLETTLESWRLGTRDDIGDLADVE